MRQIIHATWRYEQQILDRRMRATHNKKINETNPVAHSVAGIDDNQNRAILKEVQARLQRNIVAGAIYATLDRLERKALISSRLGSGTAVRGGRARRYYLLEDEGLRALNESREADAMRTDRSPTRTPGRFPAETNE